MKKAVIQSVVLITQKQKRELPQQSVKIGVNPLLLCLYIIINQCYVSIFLYIIEKGHLRSRYPFLYMDKGMECT